MLKRMVVIASVLSTTAVLASASPVMKRAPAAASPEVHSVRGDRLAVLPSNAVRHVVASVTTTVSAAQPTVTMRDPLGHVLYASDPRSGTTTVSRNAAFADLPVGFAQANAAPLKAAAPNIVPLAKIPVGCERAVSSLTRSEAARLIGRCLT